MCVCVCVWCCLALGCKCLLWFYTRMFFFSLSLRCLTSPLGRTELLHSATTGRKLQCFQGGLQNMRAQTKKQVTLSLLPGPNNFDRHGVQSLDLKRKHFLNLEFYTAGQKCERKNDRRCTAILAVNLGLLSYSRIN